MIVVDDRIQKAIESSFQSHQEAYLLQQEVNELKGAIRDMLDVSWYPGHCHAKASEMEEIAEKALERQKALEDYRQALKPSEGGE